MKTPIQSKSGQAGHPAGQRVNSIRSSVAKSSEHRWERRKIREQLRRLDWALNTDDY